MRVDVALLFTAALLAPAAAQTIPALPSHFKMVVDVAQRHDNSSVRVVEWVSVPRNAAAVRYETATAIFHQWVNETSQVQFDLTIPTLDISGDDAANEDASLVETCEKSAVNETMSRFVNAETHHIRPASAWLGLDGASGLVYGGQQRVRAIAADVWQGEYASPEAFQDMSVRGNITVAWASVNHTMFEEGEGGPAVRTPLLVAIQGHVYNATSGDVVLAEDGTAVDVDVEAHIVEFDTSTTWLAGAFTPVPLCKAQAETKVPLPAFPESFSAEIEATFVDKAYTMNVYEVYDTVNNRERLEMHTSAAMRTMLYDFDAPALYTIVDNGETVTCVKSDGVASAGRAGFDATTGHLLSTRDLFALTADHEYSHIGQSTVRGVTVDQFTAQYIGSFSAPGTAAASNVQPRLDYKMTWSYAAEGWAIGNETHAYRIPMRAHMVGSEIDARGVSQRWFEHDYHFVSFTPDDFDPSHFTIPYGCPDSTEDAPVDADSATAGASSGKADSGDAMTQEELDELAKRRKTGAIVTFFITAIAIAVGAFFFLRRHRRSLMAQNDEFTAIDPMQKTKDSMPALEPGTPPRA